MSYTVDSVNKDNQLLIKTSPKDKPRKLAGRFMLDKYNSLLYLVNEPSGWQREFKVPTLLKFTGTWSLNADHDLVLDLTEADKFGLKTLVLNSQIFTLDKNSIIFKVRTKPSEEVTKISFLKLQGKWTQDKFNRLVFELEKRQNSGTLTFKGAWGVNKRQQIVYSYAKLKTRRKNTLTFEGFWQIFSKNVLTYVLEGSRLRVARKKGAVIDSGFNFMVNLQTPTVRPQKGQIKYRVGIGARKDKKTRLIILHGLWKFSRKLGLGFEMNYGPHNVRQIKFSAVVSLSKSKEVSFSLKNRLKEPVGITLVYRQKLLAKEDLEYFLRVKKEGKNPFIGFGATLHF
ncbi:MAG: hypothetical protein JW734_08335 [Candidatus Omnitrophica bacterium]|nr:hypothetical protein [Candidatus Omnitrophota bacterium]